MATASAIPGATERRVRLTHHVIKLDDGHEVGVSLGGQGVPLVFMHGLALSRRAYLRMLSRIAGLGFLVVAIDAAGHGDTRDLPHDANEFAHRLDLTVRILDALGIHKAVVAGHSMGGRMAIQLAANAPGRTLAVVLFDAAAGAPFDEAVRRVASWPRMAMQILFGAALDTQWDRDRLSFVDGSRYLRLLASVTLANARRPGGITGAARAIIRSGDYTPLLHRIREQEIPTMVLHGERDLIVPFDNARDVAEDADASLYRVPGAYHSWMIANPRHGADSLRQLLNGELGEVLQATADALGIADCRDTAAWDRALLQPNAWVRKLTGDKIDELGAGKPEHVEMELVRRAKRSAIGRRRLLLRSAYRPLSDRWPGWSREYASRWRAQVQPNASTG